MSGNKLLLDTNAVSYFLSGHPVLKNIFEDKELYISVITEMELLSYAGFSSEERKHIKLFIEQCFMVELSPEIKKTAISLRLSFRIKLPDAIIAATSVELDIPLVSLDNDFTKIKPVDLILVEI
jgi:predicted nucleic acid-binding protein